MRKEEEEAENRMNISIATTYWSKMLVANIVTL